MKLKKFFAGVLAAAMMLTVGATAAFATTAATDKSDAPAEKVLTTTTDLGITKVYEIKKGNSPKIDFYFDAIYKSELSTPYGTDAGTNVKDIKVSFDATDKDVSGSLDLTIEKLGLAHPNGPGKYVFEIKEQIPTDGNKVAGVAYDENTRYLSITVANKQNSDGTYAKGEYVYQAQLYTQYNKGEDNRSYKADAPRAFVNKYGNDGANDLVHNLVIAKAVEGSFADLGQTFDFEITLSAANGKANSYAGANVVSAPEGAGVTANQVLEIGKKHTVHLKRNEMIELSNIPAGVKVTVEETNGNGYDVTLDNTVKNYNLIPGATLTGTKVNEAVMPEDNASVGFRNVKEGTPDMGVVLDNAPYIAMLAIVAIGGVALMLNKRRRDEE